MIDGHCLIPTDGDQKCAEKQGPATRTWVEPVFL